MRRIATLLILLFGAIGLSLAQVPGKIDFQAVARDASGEILSNQLIRVKTGVVMGSLPGVMVYQEEHEVTTDAFGHFVLPVGAGDPLQGTFSDIDWGGGSHFLQLEMDTDESGNFLQMGTLEMMTVPYAFYAERVGDVDDADADPTNELQQLSVQGEVISISGGNSIQIPDASTSNEL